ncbi:MAG: hypothetical protein ACM3KL_03275 [Alphaproteobacteria bacterium]|jgi:hypothetical protein
MRPAKTNFAEDRQALLDDIPRRYTLEAAKHMKPDDSNESEENTAFNGAELSESVLGRDWNSKEEEAAWSNL